MKQSIKIGVSFGLTSGIITTLGLMVGLSSGTHSTLAVIGGILTIAIADALSDALGIHISEEARGGNNKKEVWMSAIITFFAKFIFALTFIIPVLLFELPLAIIISIVWGLSVLCLLSYNIAPKKEQKFKVIIEHLIIALVVITITHYTGIWINLIFN